MTDVPSTGRAGPEPGSGRESTLRGVFGIPQLVLLGALGAAGPFGTDFYLASMPEVARDFGASTSAVQGTLSAFTIGLAVGQLVLGPLSDRFGRFRLLLGGLVLLVISSILCALAPSVLWLIVWRLVQGLGGAAALVLSRAIVADLATGSMAARIFSVLSMISGIAPIVAPVVGGLIAEFADWRLVFWVLTGVNAALLAVTLAIVRETLPAGMRHRGGLGHTLRTTLGVLRNRQFLGYAGAVWLCFGAMFGYIAASPFVYQEILGFSPAGYSVMFAINACGISGTAALSAVLVRRFGPRRLALTGVLVMILAALVLGVSVLFGAVTAVTIVPALFLIPSSMALVLGNCTALAIEPMAHARGTALALLGSLQFATAAVVAPIVGVAGAASAGPFAAVAIVCSVLALGGIRLARRAPAP